MTGRLDFVLKFRDAQVAEDVRKKAELGWFEQEFTMYGTAYLAPDGMTYKVSADAGKIYRFIDDASAQQIFCGNVLSLTKTQAVPVGAEASAALAVKKELACRLRQAYPPELFLLLDELADYCRTDAAYDWLIAERDALEGVFDEERLHFFERLIRRCYSCQKLSAAHYQTLTTWLQEEFQGLLDSFVSKDIFEKHFYGLAYSSGTGYRYLYDSLPETLYQRQAALEEQGVFVSPVIAQTRWYNYTYTLADARRDYQTTLHTFLNTDRLQKLQHLATLPNPSIAPYSRAISALGPEAQATVRRYLGRFGCQILDAWE